MTVATATFYDARSFDGRVSFRGNIRRIPRAFRSVGGSVVFGAGAVAAAGLLIMTVTFAAGWMVNTSIAANPPMATPAGPGRLALAPNAPALADAPAVTFADKWARATGSMQASVVPLLPQETQVAKLSPEVPAAGTVSVTPLPPKRPTGMANIVPLPRPYPAQREFAFTPVRQASPQHAAQVAAMPPPEQRIAALPVRDSRTAVYDISAHTVYLPNGERLEAHSGLYDKMDDPRFVNVRMRGATPPNVYDLTLREESFHGVQAIRLNPVDEDKMYGRAGMLAHTYMLGPNGQSNGCVSFKDYQKFLQAYLSGEIDRLVVVARRDDLPSRVARERRSRAEHFAANN
ncbi:MAG TPA: tlde1 domain-containing protein [Pseudolabrys sp.]|nr:tlde1 domain-containing protein [Pseudolabrys sp.]